MHSHQGISRSHFIYSVVVQGRSYWYLVILFLLLLLVLLFVVALLRGHHHHDQLAGDLLGFGDLPLVLLHNTDILWHELETHGHREANMKIND